MPAAHPWIDKTRPLLERFEKIEKLSLDAIVWADLESETKKIFLTKYPLVTDLWASTCDFWDPRDFVRLLQAFPKIESVRMEGVGWDSVDCEDALHDNVSELCLRWLDVGDLCSAPSIVAKWAWSHRTSISIENIHFSWGCENPVDLGRVLRMAGSSVRTLSLTIDDHVQRWVGDSDAMQDPIDLSHNTELRSFRLLMRLESYDLVEMSWVSDVLSRLPSSHLASISIFLEVLFSDQVLRINWSQIDAALADTRLRSLRKVDVCVLRRSMIGSASDALDPGTPEKLRNALPKLTSRGILDVTQQYS